MSYNLSKNVTPLQMFPPNLFWHCKYFLRCRYFHQPYLRMADSVNLWYRLLTRQFSNILQYFAAIGLKISNSNFLIDFKTNLLMISLSVNRIYLSSLASTIKRKAIITIHNESFSKRCTLKGHTYIHKPVIFRGVKGSKSYHRLCFEIN